MKIVSWNVNGIRAAAKKDFEGWLGAESPDVLCLQETKASPEQLPESLASPAGYHAYFASAERKGYSGVAIYSREKPRAVDQMGIPRFDAEGRVLVAEYAAFTLVTAYFPNSQDGGKRLDYKLDFCEQMRHLCDELTRGGRRIVLCGDFNIARRPIDLARPEANEESAGYLPEERAWMERFLSEGYIDTFRIYTADGGHYTWWAYYNIGSRERNVGWRIDYHCVNAAMMPHVTASTIRDEVMGSDHCPVALALEGL